MAEIPGLVWFFVGLFVLIASVWFGNEAGMRKFTLFITAAVVMVLVGVIKMIVNRKPREEKTTRGRFCSRCGAGLGAVDQFCPRCGNRAA